MRLLSVIGVASASAIEQVKSAGGFGLSPSVLGEAVGDDVLKDFPPLSARPLPRGVEIRHEGLVDLTIELCAVIPRPRAPEGRHGDINNTSVIRCRGFSAPSACWNITRV